MKDREYLVRVRQLQCCMCGSPGPNQAHHKTGAGLALKASDYDAMPLCVGCHDGLHGLSGRFKGWDKNRLREWQSIQVERTKELLK